jgi:hypothetical protein
MTRSETVEVLDLSDFVLKHACFVVLRWWERRKR